LFKRWGVNTSPSFLYAMCIIYFSISRTECCFWTHKMFSHMMITFSSLFFHAYWYNITFYIENTSVSNNQGMKTFYHTYGRYNLTKCICYTPPEADVYCIQLLRPSVLVTATPPKLPEGFCSNLPTMIIYICRCAWRLDFMVC
jgi:hypothetical protein